VADLEYNQVTPDGGMASGFSEGLVEEVVVSTLQDLGYTYQPGAVISPDGSAPTRLAYVDVLLSDILTAAVDRLNPLIPADARRQAMRQLSITKRRLWSKKTVGCTVSSQRAWMSNFPSAMAR